MGSSSSFVLEEESSIKSLTLTTNWDKTNYTINNSKDQIFESVTIGENRKIIGSSNVLKLTVLRDVIIEKNAILMNQGGAIILEIAGNLYLDQNAQIMTYHTNDFDDNKSKKKKKKNKDDNTNKFGEISIKCKNLTLESNASIKTSNIANPDFNEASNYLIQNDDKDQNKTVLFGNVRIKVENDIILNKNSTIQSGDININCNCCNISDLSIIYSLRNNLTMNIKETLKINQSQRLSNNLRYIRARNSKQVNYKKLDKELMYNGNNDNNPLASFNTSMQKHKNTA